MRASQLTVAFQSVVTVISLAILGKLLFPVVLLVLKCKPYQCAQHPRRFNQTNSLNSNKCDQDKNETERAAVKCYNCDSVGHRVRDCKYILLHWRFRMAD